MKYEIRYHEIMSDHILAVPEFVRKEVVEAPSLAKLDKYIKSKKDDYGHPFRKASASDKRLFGFDYISKSGAVKYKRYKPPKVKKI